VPVSHYFCANRSRRTLKPRISASILNPLNLKTLYFGHVKNSVEEEKSLKIPCNDG